VVNIGPSQGKFKTLVSKNAIKPEIGPPPPAIFPESLDPLGKNFSYPLPWIFNLCVSLHLRALINTTHLRLTKKANDKYQTLNLTAKTEETSARRGTQQRHHGEQHDPAQAPDGDRLHQEGRRRRSRQVRPP
jgi:hypothetical protein